MKQYQRKSMRRVEAFEFTRAMMDGTEKVPGIATQEMVVPFGGNVFKKDEAVLTWVVRHGERSRTIISPGEWAVKCLDTGETMVFGKREYFEEDFKEIS